VGITLRKLKRGVRTAGQLAATAANDGKFIPTLALVVECGTDVLLARYRKSEAKVGGFMLPQGQIRERERFEYTAWRILTDEFGMVLPHPDSAAWTRSVLQIFFMHQNVFDERRSVTGVAGKVMTFCKVTVERAACNLDTSWNRTRETNPPEAIEWVRAATLEDLEVIRSQYFSGMRTEEKKDAEIHIIATALGLVAQS